MAVYATAERKQPSLVIVTSRASICFSHGAGNTTWCNSKLGEESYNTRCVLFYRRQMVLVTNLLVGSRRCCTMSCSWRWKWCCEKYCCFFTSNYHL